MSYPHDSWEPHLHVTHEPRPCFAGMGRSSSTYIVSRSRSGKETGPDINAGLQPMVRGSALMTRRPEGRRSNQTKEPAPLRMSALGGHRAVTSWAMPDENVAR